MTLTRCPVLLSEFFLIKVVYLFLFLKIRFQHQIQQINLIISINSIVPALDDEDYPSSKSDSSDQEDQPSPRTVSALQSAKNLTLNIKLGSAKTSDEDDEIGDGLRTTSVQPANTSTQLERTNSLPFIPQQVERRRRKLPEIPKNKKCKKIFRCTTQFLF